MFIDSTVPALSAVDLDYIAKEIRSRLEFGKKHEEKALALYTSAGAMLADARPHFDTKVLFELWCENKIGCSVSWAYELMARHMKPELAPAMRAAATVRKQEQREREKSVTSRTNPQPVPRETPSSGPLVLSRARVVSQWTEAEWAHAQTAVAEYRAGR